MTKKNKFIEKKHVAFLGLGVEVAGAIGASVFVGYTIDNYFETLPAFILVFTLLGTLAAFWRVIRIVQWMNRQ